MILISLAYRYKYFLSDFKVVTCISCAIWLSDVQVKIIKVLEDLPFTHGSTFFHEPL